MKKKAAGAICMSMAMILAACGSTSGTDTESNTASSNDQTEVETNSASNEAQESEASDEGSAVAMFVTGNSAEIVLADIAEEDGDAANAWLKVATQYDPDLTVYDTSSLAEGTIAVEVTFEVSNFDGGEATLYWCYQLTSGGESTAVWDTSSPTDTLTITEDGTYRMLFDANAALGGAIEDIESFQIVFPCTMDTTTVVTLTEAKCITDEADLELYATGKLD